MNGYHFFERAEMNWQSFLYLAPLVASATLSATIAVYCWRHRDAQGALALAWLMFLVAAWCLVLAFMLGSSPQTFTFWHHLNYLPLAAIPAVFLIFVLAYLGWEPWLTRRRLVLLFTIPVLTQIMVWTNPILHFFTQTVEPAPIVRDSLVLPAPNSWGPGLMIHTAYSYLLLLLGGMLLIIAVRRAAPPYRRQAIMMLIALIPAWLANIFVALDTGPSRLLPQPIGMFISGLAFAFAIFRYRLLDLVPIARDALIYGMRDGMIVMDTGRRIVDINPAALRLIGQSKREAIGQSAEQLPAPWRDLMTQIPTLGDSYPDVVIPQGGIARSYSPRVLPLLDLRGGVRGHLAILHDITERKQAEEDLKHLNEELDERVKKRTADLSRRAAELQALTNVSTALRRSKTRDEMVANLIREIVSALKADAVAVLVLEQGNLVIRGLYGIAASLGEPYPPDAPLWQVMDTGEPFWVECSPRASLGVDEAIKFPPDMSAAILVPLQAAEKALGLLAVAFREPVEFTEEYRRLWMAIAEMGALTLQRIQTRESLEQLVQHRTRDLNTLYEVTALTNEALALPTTLRRELEKTLEVMNCDRGMLHLLDADGQTWRLVAYQGFDPEIMQPMTAWPSNCALLDSVRQNRQAVILPDLRSAAPLSHAAFLAATPAYIGVPIEVKGDLLGVFGETIQRFSAEDLSLLAAIAAHIGIAVVNARLHERAEQAAIMEERQRLARDLHDSVTQALYSVLLFADASAASLRAGNSAQAQQYQSRLSETAQQALREMRLLIYELRPSDIAQEGLIGALRRRLDAVERRAGIEVHLDAQEPMELPIGTEMQLYYVAHEALNNSLKHSGATRINVRLCAEPTGVQCEIADNGIGFDVATARHGAGMGLASMSERAERLGGMLQISSQPGRGTRIRVVVPQERET